MHISKSRATNRGVNAEKWYLITYRIEPLTTKAVMEVGGWPSTASHDAGDLPLASEVHIKEGGSPWPFAEDQLTGTPADYEETAIDWLLTLAEFTGGTKVA